MDRDTTKPHECDTLHPLPLSDLNDIDANEAIAVRSIKDDNQTILAGTTTSVPEQAVETIIRRQDNPYNATTVVTPVIDIDADIHWHIDENDLTDYSSRLEDRPPVKRHYRDEPSDPPPCSLAVTNHHDVELVIPMPNGSGEVVKDYYPVNHGDVVQIQTGPLVNPAHLLPAECDPPS